MMTGFGAGLVGAVRGRVVVSAAVAIALAVSMGPVATRPAAGAVVVNPDTASVERGAAVAIPILDNDLMGDPPPDGPITVEIGTTPLRGAAAVVDADGTGPELPQIRYEASKDAEVGDDAFDYTVTVAGAPVGTASVTVDVRNAAPAAVDDAAIVRSAPSDTVMVDVLRNDSDPDGGTLSIGSAGTPEHGTAAVDGGGILYDPVDDYVGTDTFGYTVSDGQGGSSSARVVVTVTDATVPMTINPDTGSATAGVALVLDVLANDESGGRGPLMIALVGPSAVGATVTISADGLSLTYLAPATFAGSDTFDYSVIDRRANVGTGQVTVLVQPPAPVPTPTPAKPSVAIEVTGPLRRADVPFSYRPGCPVKPLALRRMTLNYWDYSGKVRRGTLIVRADAVSDLSHVFTVAFNRKFRIKKMIPSDAFYDKGRRSPTASDRAAMAAGNTSAFNCRPVVGNPTKRSQHSYGVAIDINTFENPYVVAHGFYPKGAGAYLRRSPCRTGMICRTGPVATAMLQRGWYWGARWSRPDYQHFSSNGG